MFTKAFPNLPLYLPKTGIAEITLSLGIASSNPSESMDVILKKADDALYIAKATKNKIIVAK
jgi:PleD family two-component response regulator